MLFSDFIVVTLIKNIQNFLNTPRIKKKMFIFMKDVIESLLLQSHGV
jgi:hypothetical protein